MAGEALDRNVVAVVRGIEIQATHAGGAQFAVAAAHFVGTGIAGSLAASQTARVSRFAVRKQAVADRGAVVVQRERSDYAAVRTKIQQMRIGDQAVVRA